MAEPVVLQTLADLVSIPSVNSAYPDGVGEAAVVEYLRAFCAQREIWLAATIDEEHAFRGVAKLCEDFRADGAVVAEPTGLRAVVATKGVLRWPIRVLGRAAHSAKPHLGLNAISEMARLVLDLEDENERLAANPHPLLGPATPTSA
ncbi:MAG: peptidase dimerization domain-containing protein [Bryobacterales bacterium]